MISRLKGIIELVNKDSVVLMTAGGVGYEVKGKMPKAKGKIGDEVLLHTYLKVSEQALELYGFETGEEREFFALLLGVSGVGPKAALRILSLGSLAEIQAAIGRGDTAYLSSVQGIGQKTAARLVVELKSKILNLKSKIDGGSANVDGQILSEVIEALTAMGYERDEAKRVVQGLESEGRSTEELLRLALRHGR